MAYGGFKDLGRRKDSDKVLRGKAFNIAKYQKHDEYHRGFASMLYKIFDKKSASGSGFTALANKSAIKNKITQNKQLTKELHKPVIKGNKRRTVYSAFQDNI